MQQPKLSYKETHSLEDRKQRVKEQKLQYPDMIPIIVEKKKKCKLPDLEKVKYLVNTRFKLSQLKVTLKSKLKLDERTSALFIYSGQTMINDDQTMDDIYNKFQDKEDGFLYLTYTDTEVFG